MYKLVKYRINSRLNAGFYTAFSASSLLYISLASQKDSTAEVKLLCSCEITMKLLVVYCWFNSFTYMILFGEEERYLYPAPAYITLIGRALQSVAPPALL